MNTLQSNKDVSHAFYLQHRNLFSPSMTAPPAESFPHVIQFELTEGCSYGACTFCDMPRGGYRVKTLPEYKKHVDSVWDAIRGKNKSTIRGIERLFIGGENALSVDTSLLQDAATYTIASFEKNTGRLPRRITVYGNTRDILSKKNRFKSASSELRFLNCGGVCGNCSRDKFGSKIGLGYIYWGVESGDTETLRYVGKGYTHDDILKAGNAIDDSRIGQSVTIIPGLGGAKFASSHLEKTISVLNEIMPAFVTFIGINPAPHTRYAQRMAQEIAKGANRPLTPKEVAEQTAKMLEGLKFGTTVGCFGSDIQKFGYNPVPFGSIQIEYYSTEEKRNVLLGMRNKIMAEDFEISPTPNFTSELITPEVDDKPRRSIFPMFSGR